MTMPSLAIRATLLACLVFLASVAVSQATPPVDGGSLTLLTPNPSLGTLANFEYTLSGHVNECPLGGTNKCARIQVVCSQAGAIVYGEARPAVHPTDFLLGGGSSPWLQVGGPAQCVATLYYWRFHPNQVFVPLAAVSFTAGG